MGSFNKPEDSEVDNTASQLEQLTNITFGTDSMNNDEGYTKDGSMIFGGSSDGLHGLSPQPDAMGDNRRENIDIPAFIRKGIKSVSKY